MPLGMPSHHQPKRLEDRRVLLATTLGGIAFMGALSTDSFLPAMVAVAAAPEAGGDVEHPAVPAPVTSTRVSRKPLARNRNVVSPSRNTTEKRPSGPVVTASCSLSIRTSGIGSAVAPLMTVPVTVVVS